MASKQETGNIISRSISFVRESNEELRKVHTPSRQETIQATMLVLAMVVFFAFFLGLTDLLVGKLMENILT